MTGVRVTVTDGDDAAVLYLPSSSWLTQLDDLRRLLLPRVSIYVHLDEERLSFVLRRAGRRSALEIEQRPYA